MIRFILRRLGQGLIVVFCVSIVVFSLSWVTGDPAALILPPEATPAQIEEFRKAMGFDRPILVQYWDFLTGAITLDFGKSLMQGTDAMQLVLERLWPSLKLALVALTASIVIAVPLGMISALKRGTIFDQVARVLALIGQCAPNFYVGIVLILVFAVNLRMFPAIGDPSLKGIVLPAVTLGLYAAAETMRLLRSGMLEVLGEDYVRTARAKGVAERWVLLKHALRNAAIPVITVMGLQLNTMMGRAVVTETVFGYPGMGMLAVRAINNRDFIVIQAFVIVMAVVVVALNLIVDLIYSRLDPRISVSD
ncbi:MAG TPA: ABC transporter permease [Acidimicrobiia bacterium]|nr:ABC transporter permease [Acidimicrobiia bacterium]